MQVIISACCFLQYTQTKDDEIKIQDVDRACNKLRVRSGMALTFLDKWESVLKTDKAGESCDSKVLNCSEDLPKQDSTLSDGT